MIHSTYRFIAITILWGGLGLFAAGIASATAAPEASQGDPEIAATDAGAPVEDSRDPEALAELQRATDFLTALPRFHIQAQVIFDVMQDDGRRLQFEKHGDIYLQRPDRLFADIYLDDGGHRQFWYDGKALGIAERSRNLHTQVKAPPTIDGMLDLLEGLFKDPMPLSDLLYADLGPLTERALAADIVGTSLVNGRPCLHLSFRGQTVDWQLWVEEGDTPFIRKLAISYREQPGSPQYVAWLDLWDTPEHFSDGLFTFAVPADSQWINVLVSKPRATEEGGQP